MKTILITGKNSYIGSSLENWLMQEPYKYKVDSMSLKDSTWEKKDFSRYDVVFHVAGVAHIKETKKNQNLYYTVNRDLAYKVAKKCKEESVKQFIFLSSMSVYGLEKGVIDEHTVIQPKTAYGKSKFQAEQLIGALASTSFRVAILRPPMVYGKGCKGNYPRLAKLALKTPIFPKIENKRSMIYIDNLSEFVKLAIEEELNGTLFPQDREYVNTADLVQLVAKFHGKKVKLTNLFNVCIYLGVRVSNTFRKVFYSFTYDIKLPGGPKHFNYHLNSFKENIKKTEI